MSADIVAAARGWLGTRWQHQGRLRGNGVDCVGLVLGAAAEAGAVTPADVAAFEIQVAGYGRQPDGRLLALARQWLREIPLAQVRPGDVLAMRFERDPQHLALVGGAEGALTLIHAHAIARRVVEHRFDDVWRARTVAAFRFPGAA